MAFKFKTKKRPTAAQAFAGGFAQGVSSGIQQAAQLSLQDRLKKQEEEKNRLKRELDLFNGMIGNIEQSSANREAILKGKQMIIRTDGKVGASQAFSSISPDFTFTPTKAEQEAITRQISTAEKRAMETAGMVGRPPTELERKQRVLESEVELGLRPIKKEVLKEAEEKIDTAIAKQEREAKESIGMLAAQPTPFEEEQREQEARIRLGLDLPPSQKSRAKLTPAQITKTIENLYDEMNTFWRKTNNLPPLSDAERDEKLRQINQLRGMKLNMTPTITVPSESTSVGMPSDRRTSLEGF